MRNSKHQAFIKAFGGKSIREVKEMIQRQDPEYLQYIEQKSTESRDELHSQTVSSIKLSMGTDRRSLHPLGCKKDLI